MTRVWTALLFGTLATACTDDAPAPGVLEIGVPGAPCTPFQEDPSGCPFSPVADGGAMPVLPGPGSYVTVYPSLRAEGVDPEQPEVEVTVKVDGFVLGAEVPREPVDMRVDGTSRVLWSVPVRLQAELCCFACRAGTLDAELRDARGRAFRGSARVQLARATCPDPEACCDAPDACPAPLSPQLCD